MNKIIIFLIMISSFIYAEKVPLEQAQRAATDKISSFYTDSWFLYTNLTYYSESDDAIAYGFVFTNLNSRALDDRYKTTTTSTFETYTDSDQPIVLKVYKGIPDVLLWQDSIPETMKFEKYIMISPMVTAIGLSSNGVSYYLKNNIVRENEVNPSKLKTANVLNNVLQNEKYKKMAQDAWKRYEK